MPFRRLEQCSVRTSVLDGNDRVNYGSGVLVKEAEAFFVVTAYHCLYGENDEYLSYPLSNFFVEFQVSYKSDFSRIPILQVISADKTYDWALLKIDNPKIDCDFAKISRGSNFILGDYAYFQGYQHFAPTESRRWQTEVLTGNSDEFKVSLKNKTLGQGGELGSTLAKGLSGSGIYIIRGDALYLIGHLKSVIGEIALNDDIMCCSVTKIHGLNASNIVDLSSLEELDIWERNAELKATEEEVKQWTSANDTSYQNLVRKCSVVYSPEKAREVVSRRILNFLEQEYTLEQIRSTSNVVAQYEKTAIAFENTVKENYNRAVENDEAKDVLIKLEADFQMQIKDLLNNKTGKSLDLARHMVTKWLMICTFDFKE